MHPLTSRTPTPARTAWLASAAIGGLLIIWGAFWFLLLWDRAPGRATSLGCALLTAISVTLAFGGLALSVLGAGAGPGLDPPTPDPSRTPAAAAPRPAKAGGGRPPLVLSVAFVVSGRQFRLDRPHARAARACRPHRRFRWPES
jgi:hypothetical protein